MKNDLNVIKQKAKGQWSFILANAGIPSEFLKKKAGPCPFCGGTDRWTWDDKEGRGTGFCRQCDATGDGFHLLAKVLNLNARSDFAKLLNFVAEQVGHSLQEDHQIQITRTADERSEVAVTIWNSCIPLSAAEGAAVDVYLKSRRINLSKLPEDLRFHPGLQAYEFGVPVGVYPTLIAAIRNRQGQIVAIHRTYLDPKGGKATLEDGAKKVLGPVSGGAIYLSDTLKNVVGIAEGIENALSVAQATSMSMIAAPTGPVMKNIDLAYHIDEIHIWADLDRNKAGEKYAYETAKKFHQLGKKVFVHFPSGDIPDNKKGIDWNDLLISDEASAILDVLEKAEAWSPRPEGYHDWPQPEKLPRPLIDVPKLDLDMLPSSLRPWIEDLSNRMQLPPEFIASCAISVLGSAIGRRCGIYPMQKNDWLVVPCIWGGLVAPPSVLKTPAMAAALRPLKALESKKRREYQDAFSSFVLKNEFSLLKLDTLKTQLKKDMKSFDDEQDDIKSKKEEINKIKAEIEAETPVLPRYLTNDATIEKLGELLKENPHGIFIFRDELFGFLKTLEKQGHENDRAFYLEAWNGLGSYTFDRIQRGTIHIPSVCVSIFGGIQPDRLTKYFSTVLEGGSGDDGFLSRFQILVYPDLPSTYTYTDVHPDLDAQNEVVKMVEALALKDYGATGAFVDPRYNVPGLRFSPDAQEIFKDWFEKHQQRLLTTNDDASFVSHLGKYRSLFPALALIFHLADHCKDINLPLLISADSARKAEYWVGFLESHARRVYGQVMRSELLAAHALAKKIRKERLLDGSTVRDIYRNEWSGLTKPEVVREGLAVLENLGWLRVEFSTGGLGARSEVIRLNPKLSTGGKGEKPDQYK